jgi:hypothetical protein
MSAVISLRWRNSGRSFRKARAMAPPKTARKMTVARVSFQFSQNSTVREITAVSPPPTSWMMPVPTRLRTPSASFMTREITTPLLVLSK